MKIMRSSVVAVLLLSVVACTGLDNEDTAQSATLQDVDVSAESEPTSEEVSAATHGDPEVASQSPEDALNEQARLVSPFCIVRALARAGRNIGLSTAVCLAQETVLPCVDKCLPTASVPGISLGCQICVATGLIRCGISTTGDSAREIAAALRACF
jgi:hypothetical protein